MLVKLSIRNYAIIDELEINFSGQLNVITGETGAGKSIIVGALGLILGQRADTSVLNSLPERSSSKEKKCVIEGVFHVEGRKDVLALLDLYELDVAAELVIRREISASGKSRAFVNDTPVNLAQLQALSSLLVDLHQQFDTLELGESGFQREVLDALADHAPLLQAYQAVFHNWQAIKKEWQELLNQKQQFDKEAGYHQFQFNELEEAAFAENELEETAIQLKMLENAADIKAALDKVYYALQESDNPVVQQLKSLAHQIQPYGEFHAALPPLLQRLQSSQIELQDIADELGRISHHVNYDNAKIETLNERLSAGYKLLKKHGVKTTNELREIQQQLAEKLQAVMNMDDSILQKEKNANRLLTEATKVAAQLAKQRREQVKPLEEKVNKLLVQVGMPNARVKAEIQTVDLNEYGTDTVEFLFDANVAGGQAGKAPQFQPIRKVASGGELSRLMLCIKSIIAESIDLPTMIFDEIDTGISGEAARQVGIIMKTLAAKRQVICITHQPQIAGKATAHFFVYKEIIKDTVKTNIRQLDTEERITAIAKMLGGERPTAAALQNAREMVKN